MRRIRCADPDSRHALWRRVSHLVSILVLILLTGTLALAQEAVVTRNVNLRRDPSTSQPPIRMLVPPDTVELLEPDKANGHPLSESVRDAS
jgi:hypothetical protein